MKADKAQIKRLVNTARGQLDGLLKMIEEDRYCVDISNQLLATAAVLRRANQEVLRAHMQHCIKEAFQSADVDQKLDEVMAVIEKMTR